MKLEFLEHTFLQQPLDRLSRILLIVNCFWWIGRGLRLVGDGLFRLILFRIPCATHSQIPFRLNRFQLVLAGNLAFIQPDLRARELFRVPEALAVGARRGFPVARRVGHSDW